MCNSNQLNLFPGDNFAHPQELKTVFTACGIMYRRCCRPAASSMYYTTSCKHSVVLLGRNYRPKHVELIGIINKPLLLHLVGCLYYCISDARSYKHQIIIHILNVCICTLELVIRNVKRMRRIELSFVVCLL